VSLTKAKEGSGALKANLLLRMEQWNCGSDDNSVVVIVPFHDTESVFQRREGKSFIA
jgi:hypothetical protein